MNTIFFDCIYFLVLVLISRVYFLIKIIILASSLIRHHQQEADRLDTHLV